MSVSYQFLFKGKPVSLNKLDLYSCRLMREEYSDKGWGCAMFNAIHIVGPRAVYFAGAFTATREGFEKWKEESIKVFGEDHYMKYYTSHEDLLRDLVYRKFENR